MAVVSPRFQHLYSALIRPAWAWVIVGGFAVISALTWARDEFLSLEQQEAWKIPQLLPHWSIETWTIVGLIVVLILLFEGSFRRQAAIGAELATFKSASPLEIIYDPEDSQNRFVYNNVALIVGGPSVREEKIPHAVSYVFGVRNNLPGKTIENMYVLIHGDPIVKHLPLSRGFHPRDLHPGVTELLPLLTLQPSSRADSTAHDPDDSLNKIGNFTIRVRGKDAKESVAQFQYDPDAMPHITMLTQSQTLQP
jgi:hypothetical protein